MVESPCSGDSRLRNGQGTTQSLPTVIYEYENPLMI